MIIVLKPEATEATAQEILTLIKEKGLKPLHMPGVERVVLGALGDERVLESLNLKAHPMVEDVKAILSPYKLVSREVHPQDTIVSITDNLHFGGDNFHVFAGPCAVETHEQLLETAQIVQKFGATGLRGGAYKPRTSPYSFQGLELEGLAIMRNVSQQVGIPAITEVVDSTDVELVAEHVQILQIGARNMQNFKLLKAVGACGKPVVLKRGMSATIKELLLAAEYIVHAGNSKVIFCERGIRTYEPATRNTLDLNAVPYIKQKSHLPVIVDPSHGTGIRDLVAPMTKAAIACGADGVIVEVHRNPQEAWSDGEQTLYPEQFSQLMEEIKPFVAAAGKRLVANAE